VEPGPDTRFFFVHVMKTAGTSFGFHLQQQFPTTQIYPHADVERFSPADVTAYASVEHLVSLGPELRAAIRVYCGHFPYVAAQLLSPDVVTMSMLREPVDRTVSILKHFRRWFRRSRGREVPFEEIYEDEVVFAHYIDNHQTKIFSVTLDDHPLAFASSVSFTDLVRALDDTPGVDRARVAQAVISVDDTHAARAARNLEQLDVVGLSEDYGAFVDELRRRFGWWPAGVDLSGRANVNAEVADLPASMLRRIARDNAYDLELYAAAVRLVQERRKFAS